MMDAAAAAEPIAIGVIGRARGLRGECRVMPIGETLERLQCPVGVLIGHEAGALRSMTIRWVARTSGGMVCGFEGVDDRSGAESLRCQTIFVCRSDLPILGDGRYYEFELIGLEVHDQHEVVGKVRRVHSYPTVGALEVLWHDGRTVQVPMTPDVVKQVSTAEGWIRIDGAVLAELLDQP